MGEFNLKPFIYSYAFKDIFEILPDMFELHRPALVGLTSTLSESFADFYFFSLHRLFEPKLGYKERIMSSLFSVYVCTSE